MPYKLKYKPTGLFFAASLRGAEGQIHITNRGRIYNNPPSIPKDGAKLYFMSQETRSEDWEVVEVDEHGIPVKRRWMIVKDDSGHSYCIPVEWKDDFREWVHMQEDEADVSSAWPQRDYSSFQIEGNLTFENPRGFVHGDEEAMRGL